MRVGLINGVAGWSAAAAMALGLGLTAPAKADCKMDIVPLPVTMHGFQPRIEAEIGGNPVSLILDSGAYFSTLNPAKAEALGLRSGATLGSAGIGGNVHSGIATVETFTVAGVAFRKVPFLVGGNTGGADGLLGENFLHLYDVEYDLGHNAARIVRPQGCAGRPLAYWSSEAYMQAESNGDAEDREIHVMVEINGVRLRAVIDTGASVSLIDRDAALHAGLTDHMPGAAAIGAISGVGKRTMETWSVPVASFKFGDELIKNTRMRIGNAALDDMDMILGADFLLAHHVYVANSQNRVYFTYNGGPVFNLTAPAAAPPAPAKPPEPAPTGG